MGRASFLLLAILLLLPGADAFAGALPVLDWASKGGIDWSSGYIVGYGTGTYGPADAPVTEAVIAGGGPARNEAFRKARRSAADQIYRYCLGITIQEKLRVRDYLREDPDLRAELRRAVKAAPAWAVRLEGDRRLSVAVLYPVGGNGLSGLLGRIKGWYGDEGWRPAGAVAADSPPTVEATGIVFVVGAHSYPPVLRPRIVNEAGSTLVSFERAGKVATTRAAFIPYYTELARGLADPLLGDKPRLVEAREVRGTDIVAPPEVEALLRAGRAGSTIREEVKMIIVRQ